MKKTLALFLLFTLQYSYGQKKAINYPPSVESALEKAGENRVQLETAIKYFWKSKDDLKIKAIYFLISNMDIHYSQTYNWVDSLGHKIAFDELAYPNFEAAQQALEDLKRKTPGMTAQPVVLEDIKNVKAAYLISNVENAFRIWQGSIAKKISFNDFCEYLLPYRVGIEPLQDWRVVYERKFRWVNDSISVSGLSKTLSRLAFDCQSWFTDTWNKEVRDEPLPRLGALQLLLRKKGACEDIADLQAFILRSQGIPISYNTIPYWATSSGSHYFNTVYNYNGEKIQYDGPNTSSPVNYVPPREPSKVFRTTYSKQENALARQINILQIPDGVLQTQNYVDVTPEIWESSDIKCRIFPGTINSKISYVSVFSSGDWHPTWWGKISGDSVVYTSMPKGVVYLPTYYINHHLIAAGYPIINGFSQKKILCPDTVNTRTIFIDEQERYLIFRPGKRYDLYYWDLEWKLVGSNIAASGAHTMTFNKVPDNALLRLIPEYSRGFERPFIIIGERSRQWY